jgi:hypothetical protein
MKKKFWGLMLGAFLGLTLIGLAFANDELAIRQRQYTVKLDQLTRVQTQLDTETARYESVLLQYTAAKKEAQDKDDACKNAKNIYDRAVQNPDLTTPARVAELLGNYQNASKELKTASEVLKKLGNEKTHLENNLADLKAQKTQKENELLGIKTDIFDLKLREPVWVEGYGESFLAENITMKQCEKLALEYAQRDAIEKGGKAVLEAVTKVEMFQLVKDEIKLTVKVQVLEQDTSGEFGKAKRVIVGELIKYIARVRVKVQSIDTANPYREQLTNLEKGNPEVAISPVTETDIPKTSPSPVKLPLTTTKGTVIGEYGIIHLISYLSGKVYIDDIEVGDIKSGESYEYRDQTVGLHKVKVVVSGKIIAEGSVDVLKGKSASLHLTAPVDEHNTSVKTSSVIPPVDNYKTLMDKAYQELSRDNGKNCYVIGSFQFIHTVDPLMLDEKIRNNAIDINYQSTFKTNIEMINTKTNQKYTWELKPVPGSSTFYYRESRLTKNAEDPYLILKIPAGDYLLSSVVSNLCITKPGYHDFRKQMFNMTISELVKKEIHFTIQAKQIVCIGDYDCKLKTYICCNNSSMYYWSYNFNINLNDNFENLKATLLDGADDKLKAKLNQYEIVSAL